MGSEKNFLEALPKSPRDISKRFNSKSSNVIDIASTFGEQYFDGDRRFGYGGYYYDGRWRPVARKLIEEYQLRPGMKILDIGCAKGFLLKDLVLECPGIQIIGIDISEYALSVAETEVAQCLVLGSADNLPFPSAAFDLVISINTIHNLDQNAVCKALREIQRVGKGVSYIAVDSYRTLEEKALFEKWVLTAKFHGFPHEWLTIFKNCGYTGDYEWTILE